MKWLRDALTGANNETVAIGRLLGIVLFFLLLVLLPLAEFVTIRDATIMIDTWLKIQGGLEVYVPAMILAIGALIAGTAFTEPKPRPGPDRRDPRDDNPLPPPGV